MKWVRGAIVAGGGIGKNREGDGMVTESTEENTGVF